MTLGKKVDFVISNPCQNSQLYSTWIWLSFLALQVLIMFTFFRVKCSNPQKRMVLKSKLKSNDTTAFNEFITLICQNTTLYDQDIKDYTCTPPCEKPKTTKNIVNNWVLAAKPELADTVMHSCTKMVQKLFQNWTFLMQHQKHQWINWSLFAQWVGNMIKVIN